MPRAPKERKLNTTQCPKCNVLVKYKNDVARHMKLHDQNREELMIHCAYPGCDYKSLQKSNVVNHTRKHGFSKSRACPFSNCPFFTLYSRFLTQHLLDAHDLGCNPQSKRSKQSKETQAHSSTALNQIGLNSFEQWAVEPSASSSEPGVFDLTFSSDLRQSRQLTATVPPAQLVPGYQFPFFPDSPYDPQRDARPSYYYDENTPVVTMRGAQLPSRVAVPSQTPYAPQFGMLSDTYYIHDELQMSIQQQQAFVPTTPDMFFQDAASPLLSSPSPSVSSSSFPDNGIDVLAEIHHPLTPLSVDDLKLDMFYGAGCSTSPSSAGSSTTWENLSLMPAVEPGFMVNYMQRLQSASTPYIGDANITSTSIGLFPDIEKTGHLSTIPSPQDIDFDFKDLIL
ncbi:hypothetical protein F5887DRAFT_28611 [Amanita rubescens]|nr:hypothetical protein F5887DRAFT_28611 [Amanita rubescens]